VSRENVEAVKRAVEAWSRGDQAGAIGFWGEQIEWVSPPEDPDRVVVKGTTAAADALTKWLSNWDSYRYELIELKDVDPHVLQAGRQVMNARGAEVGSDVFFVWTFCNKQAIRMRMFYRRAEALKAVGLEE
jgi:ketosteroid isomerase-like protein